MSNKAVYLDYAATTPVDPRVIEIMQTCLSLDGHFANPASIHAKGRQSAALVSDARMRLANLLNTQPECLIWTSGATESNNLAIQGAARARAHRGRHLITMPTEHKAVIDTFKALEKEGFEVSWINPGADGLLSLDTLENELRADTQLVSVMHVNNETGVIQDISGIGLLCREQGVVFHTDAAQSVGKLDIDLANLPVDLLSLTAHKFYGPQGIGALYIADRPGNGIVPIMFGGNQERRLRPGTLPVHLIAGAGLAATIAASRLNDDTRHLQVMRDRLWDGIKDIEGLTRNGPDGNCYAGILNVSVDGVEGESLMLGMEPVCVASGSACNSTSGESSYVLRALGRNDRQAQSAVRFSFGHATTSDDIDMAIARYRWTVNHLRAIAPRSMAVS
ncbi:MAG: aminotransferase class V-fold PLP-dependent enzyme [Proteobacteria bacterium]|nr:aminotransferase class V-fold PLP-dependent enzyme [Pseudomonadota bacterium]